MVIDTEVIGNDRDIEELARREEGDIFDVGGMIAECVEDTELDQEYYYDDFEAISYYDDYEDEEFDYDFMNDINVYD